MHPIQISRDFSIRGAESYREEGLIRKHINYSSVLGPPSLSKHERNVLEVCRDDLSSLRAQFPHPIHSWI